MPKSKNVGHSLQAFLDTSRSTSTSFTHTSIGRPMGKYSVKPIEHDAFYKAYYYTVFKEQNGATWGRDGEDSKIGKQTFLTEGIKDREITPLKIDIDFRYYNDDCVRLYEDDDIDKLCMLYMEKIDHYLEEMEDDERIFYILEKPSPTKEKNKKTNTYKKKKSQFRIKDGVHIMAPGITTNVYLQLQFRDHVYKNCAPILDKYTFDNSYADIFDRAVIDRNNWQMYGSTKPGQPPYLVKRAIRVWADRVEEVDIIPKARKLVRLLSVRNKHETSLLKPEVEEEVWAPENNKPKNRSVSRKKRNGFKTETTKDQIKCIRGYKEDGVDGEYRKGYLDCLSSDRCINFATWIEVGWCLHNIDNSSGKYAEGSNGNCYLLNAWIKWSKQVEEYKSTANSVCEETWEKMNDEGLGIASLKLWAKEDSQKKRDLESERARQEGKTTKYIQRLGREPTEYRNIIQNEISTHIYKATQTGKGSSYDVAKILHLMKLNFHVCVSIKDHTWFYYNTEMNRWQRDDKGIMLKRCISTELYDEFRTYRSTQEDIATDLDLSEDKRTTAKTKAENVSKVMFRLKETSFKSNLMTECAELFYDREKIFLDKLDSYNHLIGFNNGVYDLKKDEFRLGRPEDYISKSTNIDYHPIESFSQLEKEEADHVSDIKTFYSQIFVVESVREYVLLRTSSFLSGSTRDESFDIYSGGGGNGKSKHMELVEAVFGDYAVKLPIALLTSGRAASNAATPELARTKGARLCSMQEPDSSTKINVGLMKELTGGDKIQARALYGEPFEFKPQFKMVLCCNDKPELPEKDEGTWRRVRNTEFMSRFTYDIDAEKCLHFKINEDLAENFENWAEPFMAILIEYHKKYKKIGLQTPDEILEYTESYRAQNDHLRDFVADRIECDVHSDAYLAIGDIYVEYRAWYKDHLGHLGHLARKKVQEYFNDKYGKYISTKKKKRGYKGLTIKTNFLDSD